LHPLPLLRLLVLLQTLPLKWLLKLRLLWLLLILPLQTELQVV
jgi:hypothetical protein